MRDTDILLINSFAPRQRIMSDAALENSLAILRTYLEGKGFTVEVFDELRTASVERGVPHWCIKLLRWITDVQLRAYRKGAKMTMSLLFLLGKHVQAFSLLCRQKYMDREIERIVARVKNGNIPVVGIKLWYGEAFKWSVRLAARIKESCSSVVVIVGGPQVKVYGEAVLHWQEFDLAIMGPGEAILAQLLALHRQTENKAAFLHKVSAAFPGAPLLKSGGFQGADVVCGQETAERFVLPQYRTSDIKDKLLFHTLVDGSGCAWNRCNFCSHTRRNWPYRPRPVAEIVREMKEVTQAGIGFFRFCSSETPIGHGRKIAQAIIDEGLNVNYSMFKRPGKVTKETYDDFCLMIKSGLRAVFMGGETGHDLINEKIMNKGTCKREIIDTINCIKMAADKVGESCRVGLSLIYPCPVVEDVTLQAVYEENISLISRTVPDTVVVNPPGLFPGTNWFDEAEKLGFKAGKDFIHTAMQYEYSIYKPVEAWDKIDYSLNGMSWLELLKETGRLRKAVMDMGIPTDISDEFLMMMDAIGCRSSADFVRFKQQSLLDIMTGSAKYGNEIIGKINEKSRYLAALNHRRQ